MLNRREARRSGVYGYPLLLSVVSLGQPELYKDAVSKKEEGGRKEETDNIFITSEKDCFGFFVFVLRYSLVL